MPHRAGKRPPIGACSIHFEIWLTLCMLVVTLFATGAFGWDVTHHAGAEIDAGQGWALVHLGLISLFIFCLVLGNVSYQIARIGYDIRVRRHTPPSFDDLIHWSQTTDAPPVTILVPAYKEDLRTMRQTLMTAALQHYPDRRVVLLLDNPPNPVSAEDREELTVARRLPGEIMAALREPAALVQRAERAFERRASQGRFDAQRELARLLSTYRLIDVWFQRQIMETPVVDHTDAQFVDLAYRQPRALIKSRIRHVRRSRADRGFDHNMAKAEYRLLAAQFDVEISTFERKRFVNLSHAANKAANLNSYLSLIGHRVRIFPGADGLHIEPCAGEDAGLTIPDAAYVITLDADSMLAPEYALRLIHLMEQPGNERLAIAQTPYTAIPNPPGLLERIAGATTDIQYIANQGLTWGGATFWIGANAVLRKAALDDIVAMVQERGYRMAQYIQDRTVIEDTESTIDLVVRGWKLHNVPERLSFSATPPDFGALLIQRRRWANGGLLIMPKLLRAARQFPRRPRSALEFFLRANYLVSPVLSTVSMLGLIALPLSVATSDFWLFLVAAPYYVLYGRDLCRSGYSWGDLPRIYAFNLMLLPINLAGALKSIEQAMTGEKIPFGRTPKTSERTSAPGWAIAAELLLLLCCLGLGIWCLLGSHPIMAGFSLTTFLFFAYAVVRFIGIRASVQDLYIGLARQQRRVAAATGQPLAAENNPSPSSDGALIEQAPTLSWYS